jgi:hypothetical protein
VRFKLKEIKDSFLEVAFELSFENDTNFECAEMADGQGSLSRGQLCMVKYSM